MVNFCDKCGAELKNENAKFCDKCGAEVINNNSSSTSGVTYSCPFCGKQIPYSTKCPYCGKKLKGNDDAAKAGLGIIGIIILLFLISGICGFLLIIFG